MYSFLYHTIIPFLLSALVVILVTIAAERYGTKIGGIIGTLPSTIIIAFLFIAIDKGTSFAVQSVAIVPAEMGLNLLFLFLFALFAYKGTPLALTISLGLWAIGTLTVYFLNIDNIVFSLLVYIILFLFTLLFLDKRKKIVAQSSIRVHYTPLKILFRGLLAGIIIALAVTLSNVNALMSGIFSVFPAIFLSTMIISMKEHGPAFTDSLAKGMIYGSPSVVGYAVGVYFFYPLTSILIGSVAAFLLGTGISLILYFFRETIQ
jgi:uncharacterized membrane protein (GlpM family)